MTIKSIFEEIAAESSTNEKLEILRKHKDNDLLKKVCYLAKSKRVKFYIKQIPEYNSLIDLSKEWKAKLEDVVDMLTPLSERKVTGGAATDYLANLLSSMNKDDAYIIERIIERDLKIGMGTTQINKVFEGLVEKTPYMGCKPYNEAKLNEMFIDGKEVYSDVKEDGRYCNAIIRGAEIELESRQGENTYIYQAAFVKELEYFSDCVLNGELIIPGIERYKSNGRISSLVTIGKKEAEGKDVSKEKAKFLKEEGVTIEDALNSIVYKVWDRIQVKEYFNKLSNDPLKVRRGLLESYLNKKGCDKVELVRYRIVKSAVEAKEHFAEELEAGNEGTIAKEIEGIWSDGKKWNQIKMKLEMTVDLKIVGFLKGTKGTKNENVISRIQTESSCGKITSTAGGINEKMMQYIEDNQESLLGTIVEVKSCGITSKDDGTFALLHPRFVKLRDDKTVADTFEEIQENENMLKGLTND